MFQCWMARDISLNWSLYKDIMSKILKKKKKKKLGHGAQVKEDGKYTDIPQTFNLKP
jgi:hypothetical protein